MTDRGRHLTGNAGEAVIGVGSNSVRLLVAEVADGAGRRLLRDRAATRLFAGLDEHGNLSGEALRKTVDAVAYMADKARGMGAEEVRIFATSATRDAANARFFADAIARRTGCELCVCSGEEEAVHSFLGASDVARGPVCGVIDIGGGSTEIVTGSGPEICYACSCQMGAVRLMRALPIDGPGDLPQAVAAAAEAIRRRVDAAQVCQPELEWCGTGGTFTALASLKLEVPWTDRTCTHGTMLCRQEVERQADRLSRMSLEERKELQSLQPGRADIVVHGICILLACMDVIGIGCITVSEMGNLDGYMKMAYGLKTLER